MIKRLVIVLAVLVGLLVVLDRYLASAAGDAAGGQVRRAVRTEDSPDVEFGGFPFITQALSGRLDRVDVVARDVPVSGLQIERIDARFTGVHVKLGKALAGELEAVPTDRAEATARLTYEDLNTYLRKRGSLTVSGQDGRMFVAGQVRLNGALISGRGAARVTLRAGSIVVQATEASADGVGLPPAAARLLSVTVPTRDLPFGIALKTVEVRDDALVLRGTARGIVIPTRNLTG